MIDQPGVPPCGPLGASGRVLRQPDWR